VVSFSDLLGLCGPHDPTTLNRQGNVGTQYRWRFSSQRRAAR
jgi:peptide methionine sulfoxide reductase MsrA